MDVGEVTWSQNGDERINWNKGLVMEDSSNENQFVWVPVDQNEISYNNLENRGNTSFTINDKDKNQIDEYGGFYIARYVCGVPKEKNNQLENIDQSTNNVVGIPVSQEGNKPWNYIPFKNAKNSAMMMCKNDDLHSEIVSEAFWNMTMQWIRNAGYDVDKDSNLFGNYSDSYFDFSGLYSTNYGKSYRFAENGEKENENLILSTGASHKHVSNNIYDLAGNMAEFVEGEDALIYGGNYDNISKMPANSSLPQMISRDFELFFIIINMLQLKIQFCIL